jgi:hypothetical protein
MSSKTKYAVPPPDTSGIRIFIRAAYPARYNFAVENYNAVSVKHKLTMRGGRLLLFRSVVAVVWIIALVFAILAAVSKTFVIGPICFGVLYIGLSLYNAYVYFDNRDLLNSTRLLRAKVAGPSGQDYEWVSVPIESRSANERLAAVDQSALDAVRREFTGSDKSEIECMVYTRRYADSYPSFPKELLIHIIAYVVVIGIGTVLSIMI